MDNKLSTSINDEFKENGVHEFLVIPSDDNNDYQIISNYAEQPIFNDEQIELNTTSPTLRDIHTIKYSLTPNEEQGIKQLFNKWNLGHLFPIFRDECIDVVSIMDMKDHHFQKIINKYDIQIGVEIRLEAHIKKFQTSKENIISSPTLETDELNDLETSILNSGHEQKLDINNILQGSVQGRTILTNYNTNRKLNDGSRVVIVDTIIKHMIQQGLRMTTNMAKCISESIILMFPTEFMEYYYSKQPGKKPQGKVYDKFFNSQRQLKSSGLVPKRPYTPKSNSLVVPAHFELESPESNITEQLEAIMTDNCSWAELEHHWQATKNVRLAEIQSANSTIEIFNKWKQYKKPMGYKLVNMDFLQKYPNASSLILSFDAFAFKILPIFNEKIKDPSSKKLLEDLQQWKHGTENGRCCAIFHLIHSVLVPTTSVVEGLNNKRVRTKFSISDSQGSFLILGRTVQECEEEIMRRNANKFPIQPLILVTGSILDPTEFIVYFDGVKYILNSFIEAVDICFKIFNIFNLEYPLASHLVWRFIQKYFFNIRTKYDKHNVQVECLISALK